MKWPKWGRKRPDRAAEREREKKETKEWVKKQVARDERIARMERNLDSFNSIPCGNQRFIGFCKKQGRTPQVVFTECYERMANTDLKAEGNWGDARRKVEDLRKRIKAETPIEQRPARLHAELEEIFLELLKH